jgi:hypothetical protein
MNMKSGILAGTLGIAAVACLCASPATATVPYTVDDPETPEFRHYEVNLSVSSGQVRGSETQEPYLEINYGYKSNVELTLGGSLDSVRNSGTDRVFGLGDTHLEAAWRFQEEGRHTLPLTLHYGLKIPTAGTSQGIGTGRMDHALELITGKSLGRYTLFADGGYNRLAGAGQKDNAFYGTAVTYQATEKLVVGLEGYGNTPDAPNVTHELAWDVAATYDVTPDRTVLMSVGRSAEGFSNLNVVIGFQWVLGPKSDDKG